MVATEDIDSRIAELEGKKELEGGCFLPSLLLSFFSIVSPFFSLLPLFFTPSWVAVPMHRQQRHISSVSPVPQAKKAKRLAKATKTVKSQLSAVPLPDVERCTHLTTRSVLYHAVWSGEIEKLRNGVLTHSQAWSIVAVALLLPCLGGGGTSKLLRRVLGPILNAELIRVLFVQCWSCFQ